MTNGYLKKPEPEFFQRFKGQNIKIELPVKEATKINASSQ